MFELKNCEKIEPDNLLNPAKKESHNRKIIFNNSKFEMTEGKAKNSIKSNKENF